MLLASSDPRVYLIVGFAGGVFYFFKGFREFRRYRLISDIPRCRIASAPMGLVRIRGTAKESEMLLSPVSRTPCCFYRVEVRNRSEKKDDGVRGFSDIDGNLFHLEDASGKVLIDLHGAEFDIDITEKRRVTSDDDFIDSSSMGGSRVQPFSPPTNYELLQYVSNASVSRMMPMASIPTSPHWAADGHGAVAAEGTYELKEYCVIAGEEYEITGTCVENPEATGPNDHSLVMRGRGETTFEISDRPSGEMGDGHRQRAITMIFGGAAVAIACLYIFLMLNKLL